jgi:hypothetical protein
MYNIFVDENYISSWLWSDIFLVLVVLNNMLYINILLFLLITIIVLFNKIINYSKIIGAGLNKY